MTIPNKLAEEFERANALLKQGRCEETLAIYDRLIEAHVRGDDFDFRFAVDLHKIYSNKGIALKKLGRPAEAVAAFTLAVENGGRAVPALLRMRAEAHQLNGDLDAAIADLESSLKIDPESNVGLWNVVCLSALNKDVSRVVSHLRTFAQLYPDEKEDLIKDPDLEPVRDDPEFKRVVAEL